MGTPFKMKGSPMQRNFGISPIKQDYKKTFERIKKMRDKAKKFVKSLKIKDVKKAASRGNILSLMIGASTTAQATQPGTGTHGGKKQTTYNPKTGKYE
jgi:hypothetical protein